MNNLCTLREPLFAKPATLKAYLYMAYCTKDKAILDNARRNVFFMIEGAISPLEADIPICELRDRVRSLRARFYESHSFLTLDKDNVVAIASPDNHSKNDSYCKLLLERSLILYREIAKIYESFQIAANIQDSKNILKRRHNLLKIMNCIARALNLSDNIFRAGNLPNVTVISGVYSNIGKKESINISAIFSDKVIVSINAPNIRKFDILYLYEDLSSNCLHISMLCEKEAAEVVLIAAQVAYEIMQRDPGTTFKFSYKINVEQILAKIGFTPKTLPDRCEFMFTKQGKVGLHYKDPAQDGIVIPWQKKVRDNPILFGSGPLLPTY